MIRYIVTCFCLGMIAAPVKASLITAEPPTEVVNIQTLGYNEAPFLGESLNLSHKKIAFSTIETLLSRQYTPHLQDLKLDYTLLVKGEEQHFKALTTESSGVSKVSLNYAQGLTFEFIQKILSCVQKELSIINFNLTDAQIEELVNHIPDSLEVRFEA
jgi:hypothetical protein